MAGNPTVIPGLFKADLSGLATLAGTIGQYLRRDKNKIDAAMEIWRDPAYAEPMGERMITAGAESFFDLPPSVGSLMRGEQPQNATSRAIDAEMIAARLDPSNPEHRQAAMSVINSAASSIDPKRAAELRVGALPKARKAAEKLKQTQLDVEQGAAEAGVLEADIYADTLQYIRATKTNLSEVESKRLALQLTIDTQRLQLKLRDPKRLEAILNTDPELAALYAMAPTPDAAVEGVLLAIRARNAGQLEDMTISERLSLLDAQKARGTEWVDALIEASGQSEQDALATLSKALDNWRAYSFQLPGLLPDSEFPVDFGLYEAGWLRQSTRVQMLFTLPPAGLNISAGSWGGWKTSIKTLWKSAENDEERKAVEEAMIETDVWQAMNNSQRVQALRQFESGLILFPDLMKGFAEAAAALAAEKEKAQREGMMSSPVRDLGLTDAEGRPIRSIKE